jgi:hypothetical protein
MSSAAPCAAPGIRGDFSREEKGPEKAAPERDDTCAPLTKPADGSWQESSRLVHTAHSTRPGFPWTDVFFLFDKWNLWKRIERVRGTLFVVPAKARESGDP